MYKLLLVTDRQDVMDAFGAVENWEGLGFRAPRMAQSARGAIESLAQHHADAIAVALPDAEPRALMACLAEMYPLLPVMRASRKKSEVFSDLTELRRLLGQVNADNSDDRYNQAEAMQHVRHAYFRKLISGKVKSRDEARRYLRLMRSRMDLDQPCVLIRFSLPEADGYLAGRWHYGPDRLEIAMRNLFGAELAGMRLLVSVLENEQIYLLACPMLGEHGPVDAQTSMTGLVTQHAEDAIRHVQEYLEIEMRIASITVLPTVTALADPELTCSQSSL